MQNTTHPDPRVPHPHDCTQCAPPDSGIAVTLERRRIDAHYLGYLVQTPGCEIAHEFEEVAIEQPPRTAQQPLRRIGWFGTVEEFTYEVDRAHCIATRFDRTETSPGPP